MKQQDIVIIGGGAAGFFAAINIKTINPKISVTILEQSKNCLNKVRISGGGRCNVTHHCFDPKLLTSYYPRGQKELLGPFFNFGAQETVYWFESRDVPLYTEPDGSMFPVANTSESIIQCFMKEVKDYEIQVFQNVKVKNFIIQNDQEFAYEVISDNQTFLAKKVMFATGSSPFVWNMLEQKGYEIVPPVPSLFTFNLPNHSISKLMGLVVVDTVVQIKDTNVKTNGQLLITHWGLSGPAILKASAWGARVLSDKNYDFIALVDWAPKISERDISDLRDTFAKKKVTTNPQFGIPSRLWFYLTDEVLVDKEKNWASLTKIE
ncbi:MAG: aminoacetone oxidase family FAD-binding enzyme, partial [Saprospiraceae bacterium]